jgi:putative flippase GtrA
MSVRGLLLHPRARPLRFLIVGGSGFLLYLLLASLLRAISPVSAPVAAALATLLSVLPVFHAQRAFTFRSAGAYSRQLLHYALLQIACAGVIALSAKACAHWLRLPDLPTFVIAGLVGVAFSYLVQATLVFGHRPPPQ